MKLAIACALMLGLSAPPSDGAKTPQDLARDELRAMEEQIDRRIGTAACVSDAECRTVAFGAKPCGGPWTYKVYSTRDTDTVALLREIGSYAAKNVELNRKYGWTSDCSLASEPGVACREGRCSAGTAGAAPPSRP
jgi:hypothetical protein